MVANVKAHTVCQNILNIVRGSNLNYLVNETPYSAHITVKKRFRKDYQESSYVTLASDDGENESLFLKNKCQELKEELDRLFKHNSDLKESNDGYRSENVN